jgi:TonB family protein
MKKRLRLLVRFTLVSAAGVLCLGVMARAQQTTQQDEVYDLRTVDRERMTAPKPVYHPDPEYTDKARKKKISGTVLVSLVVTAEGAVRDAKVTTSLDKDLDRQALKAVNTWKFQPATMDGKPVAVRISAEISFRIR